MELRWVTAAPSGSCADTKGPLRRPAGPRTPEKTDADGSLLTRTVRKATPAGRRSAAKACECPPPGRKTAHCCSCAQASGHHPHLRGIGQFVITARCAMAGAFAAIDAACSLLTRSVKPTTANGCAMAARGRMISIGRGCAAGRELLARLVASLQALSRTDPCGSDFKISRRGSRQAVLPFSLRSGLKRRAVQSGHRQCLPTGACAQKQAYRLSAAHPQSASVPPR